MTPDLDLEKLTVEYATEADSENLKKFVTQQPFLTNYPIELFINRQGSFFNKYRLQSDDFVTLKLMNHSKEILGIASMVFRKTMLNNHETLVGFATDLRISNNRQAIVQWPDLLLPALTEEATKRNCEFVFSIFNQTQKKAYNALLRPRGERRNIPRYYFYKNFDLINIHGKVPFTDLPFLSSVKIAPLELADLEHLAAYLKSKARMKPLSFAHSEELLLKRFETWPGFKKENFLIAKNLKGNIIGCVAPWKATQVMSVNVLKYSGFGETIYNFSRFFSLFNFVKKLPPSGQNANVKFLTHFNADNPDIFGALLAEVFRITQKNELLTYTHVHKTPLTMPPKNFFYSRIPFTMYTVLPPDRTLPDFLQVHRPSPPPEIEPVMI